MCRDGVGLSPRDVSADGLASVGQDEGVARILLVDWRAEIADFVRGRRTGRRNLSAHGEVVIARPRWHNRLTERRRTV